MDMAQQTVTLDEVSAAASRLQDDGEHVTIEAVREALGAGTADTIFKHLNTWRAVHAKPAEVPKAELPDAILADLGRWARRYAEEAGAGAREAAERSESDLRALLAQVDGLTAARDDALATVAEQGETIERLTISLNDARQVATDALVGKAKDQLAIEGKDAQIAELRLQMERNVTASATLSDARLTAEMELVGAVTARDNLAAEVKELRAQLASRAAR
jgi:hypothetical protein